MREFCLPLVLLVCLLTAACSGGDAASLPVDFSAAAELPVLTALDSLPGQAQHAASDIAVLTVDLTTPLLSQNVTHPSGGVELGGYPDLAFAIYRVAEPEGPLQVCTYLGSGSYVYLLAADFGSGRWEVIGRPDGTQHNYNMTFLGDATSADGYVYLAAVARRPAPGGGDADELSSLSLTYDSPIPSGPTYYVAPPASGGDDANDGSSSSPWATLQHAADTVVAGDTVVVRPGQYVGFMLQTSGAPGDPITFSAEPGVIINERNDKTPDGINIENWDEQTIHDVVIKGFTLLGLPRAGIRTALSDHITISNCTCGDNQVWGILSGHADYVTVEDCELYGSVEQHGVYLSNSSDHCIVRNNLIHDNQDCGVHHNGDASQGGDGVMSDCLIENNVIYNNGSGGGSGINCDGVQDSIIRNNLLFNNGASGISLYMIDAAEPATGNLVQNNTIVQPGGDARWCLNIADGSSKNCHVYNNILFNYHSFRGAIDVEGADFSGFESDYNIVVESFVINDGNQLSLGDWRSATGQDMHSLAADPADVLVDPHGTDVSDYMLLAASPALGMADATHLAALDQRGMTRPQGDGPDVGCFEQP